MSDFLRHFLRDDLRSLAPGRSQELFVGVFGKHPGWNDHIEEDPQVTDLGMRTPSLVMAKQSLYVSGIGSQIDRGTWEQLEASQRLEFFDHWILWSAGDQTMVVRLWSSTDGKGRSRYPMCLAAHLVGVPLSWSLAAVMPRLNQLKREVQETSEAIEVASALIKAREQLRARLAGGSAVGPDSGAFLRLVEAPVFSSDSEGLLRVLYQMETGAGAYRAGKYSPRDALLRPFEVRVPRISDDLASDFLGWNRLCRAISDPAAPLLLVAPELPGEWVDVVLGEPGPDQWFCLRATPARIPKANDIPFSLSAEFRARARTALETLSKPQASPAPEAPGGASKVSQFLSSIFRKR